MVQTDKPTIKVNNRIDEHRVTVRVVKLHFERVWLVADLEISFHNSFQQPVELYLAELSSGSAVQFERRLEKDDLFRFALNITNPGDCRCLPEGSYCFCLCSGNALLAICSWDSESSELKAAGKIFPYGDRKRAYCVSFTMVSESFPLMQVEDRVIRPAADSALARAKETLKNGGKEMLRAYYQSMRRKKRADDCTRVLFLSEQNEQLSTTLQAVYQKMLDRRLDREFDIQVSARRIVTDRYGVGSWLGVIRKMAAADQIYVDDHVPMLDWLKLSDDTQVVQLWHAGAGYKSSGYSRWGQDRCPAPFSCHRQYNYGITPSRKIAYFFSEVFGINTEQILPTGMPRMDEFLDPAHRKEKEKEIRARYPEINGKTVILFAPTFRGQDRKDADYPYEKIDFEGLYRFCGEERVVLFKMHPWVNTRVPIPKEYDNRMWDVSDYPNINDLFYVTDVLITDYSSNVFEYSLMKKPMLFFAFDETEYAASRGFHRDYRASTPGKICGSFDDLLEALRTGDFEFEKVGPYLEEHFDRIDSGACDRVIEWFILGNIPQEYLDAIRKKEEEVQMVKSMDFSGIKEGL